MKANVCRDLSIMLLIVICTAACKKKDSTANVGPDVADKENNIEAYHPKKIGANVKGYYQGVLVELLEIEDGKYLFSNDIILEASDVTTEGQPSTEGVVEGLLWNDRTVYYRINANVSPGLREMWTQATAFWTAPGLNFRFLPANQNTVSYIELVENRAREASSTDIGRNANQPTVISIDPTWYRTGSVAHEIGHALGLHHEQRRLDRNLFVNVLTRDPQYITAPESFGVGPFDFGSIMIYPGERNMMTRLDGSTWDAQRQRLSEGDRAAVNYMYNRETHIEQGIYRIEPLHARGMNLFVQTNDRNAVIFREERDSLGQQWQITHVRDGYYRLVP